MEPRFGTQKRRVVIEEEVTPHRERLGKILREVRMLRQLTIAEVAKVTGISESWLSKIELGGNTTIEIIEKICNAIRVPVGAVMMLSMEIADAIPDKRFTYKILKPALDLMIRNVFVDEPLGKKEFKIDIPE